MYCDVLKCVNYKIWQSLRPVKIIETFLIILFSILFRMVLFTKKNQKCVNSFIFIYFTTTNNEEFVKLLTLFLIFNFNN